MTLGGRPPQRHPAARGELRRSGLLWRRPAGSSRTIHRLGERTTMSVEPMPGTTPGAPPSSPKEITIVSHSTLFYWWPVWAVGFLVAALTYLDGHVMATVPSGTVADHN